MFCVQFDIERRIDEAHGVYTRVYSDFNANTTHSSEVDEWGAQLEIMFGTLCGSDEFTREIINPFRTGLGLLLWAGCA